MIRLNKFIAQTSGVSRRKADQLIEQGLITVNSKVASSGQKLGSGDHIKSLESSLKIDATAGPAFRPQTIILNKPIGYVCSRNGQGSRTIYDLLPKNLHQLKPVGRLDKDSSGLLLLTTDGELANRLTHPRYEKQKIYEVAVEKPISSADIKALAAGVTLDDGLSKFQAVTPLGSNKYKISLSEGRNRQIRRTLQALGYQVTSLHRLKMGEYTLDPSLKSGCYITL